MNKIIAIAILLSGFCTVTYGQTSGWSFINPQPTNMTLNAVHVFDGNYAIAVGYWGTLMRTTDGGNNWSNPLTIKSITGLDNFQFFAIRFFDMNTGLILGDNSGSLSKLYKTTDNGITWSVTSQFSSLARSMFFIDANTGWVGSGTTVTKTTNGGLNWLQSASELAASISSIYFLNDITGFCATGAGKIFKTSDGGSNWSEITSGSYIKDVRFINTQTGFACGGNTNSLIQKSTNSGITWVTKLNISQTGPLNNVYFANAMTGFAVGGQYGPSSSVLYRTSDGGETWSQVQVATPYYLTDVEFYGNLGFIAGYGGRIARSTDLGLSWTVSPSFHSVGSSFYSMSFINANTGWVAVGGTSGTVPIYKSTNSGVNWQVVSSVSNVPDFMQFLNASTGYYKMYNTIYKSTNGGLNRFQLPPLNIEVNAVQFSNANTGMVCGYSLSPTLPKLLKTTNGGSNWDTLPVTHDFSSVISFSFVNDSTGWIAKSFPLVPMLSLKRVYKTTNTGRNWVEQQSDTISGNCRLVFLNSQTGWVSGGKLYRTTNGGSTWNLLQATGFGTLIKFVDHATGWSVTPLSNLVKTTDGGVNWITQIDMGIGGILCMDFANSQTGWLAGSEGSIIRTSNGGEFLSVRSVSLQIPSAFSLSQNYPNPFNPSTTIKFDIPVGSGRDHSVQLTIFDALGREITTLVNEQLQPGEYSVTWDASNFASGIYFYRLLAGDYSESKKMLLIK